MGQRSRSFSVPCASERGGSLTRRRIAPPRWPTSQGACSAWLPIGKNLPVGNSRLLCSRRLIISAEAWSKAWAPLKPKLRRGPLQGAVRLVTREHERQQQRTSIKSSTLFESRCSESLTECCPRLLGPLLNRTKYEDCCFSSGSCLVWDRSSVWCLEGLLPGWGRGGVHWRCLGGCG